MTLTFESFDATIRELDGRMCWWIVDNGDDGLPVSRWATYVETQFLDQLAEAARKVGT